MATNSGESASGQNIAVQCSCGKRLGASPKHAGKRLKCPACGEAVVVPANASKVVAAASPSVEEVSDRMNKTTLIAMWSFVGVNVLGMALFLVWDSKSSHQQKITDANVAVSSAVTEAQEWLSNGAGEADAIETALADSLQNQLVTEKSDGETVLADVQKRRTEIVADAIFDSAREKLEQKEIPAAVSLLKEYVADPNATKKSEAQSLLSQAEVAMSDKLALDSLNSMSDEEFNRVKTTGVIGDGKVSHPILLAVRKDTVQRHIGLVGKQREEIRIAEEKGRNAERLAAIERKRQEDERKRAEDAIRLANETRKQIARGRKQRFERGKETFSATNALESRKEMFDFALVWLVGSQEFMRNHDKLIQGYNVLQSLSELFRNGQFEPDEIILVLSTTVGREGHTITKRHDIEAAAKFFVGNHSSLAHVDDEVSFGWLWRETMLRLKEDPEEQQAIDDRQHDLPMPPQMTPLQKEKAKQERDRHVKHYINLLNDNTPHVDFDNGDSALSLLRERYLRGDFEKRDIESIFRDSQVGTNLIIAGLMRRRGSVSPSHFDGLKIDTQSGIRGLKQIVSEFGEMTINDDDAFTASWLWKEAMLRMSKTAPKGK